MLSEVMATRRLTRREKQEVTRNAILRSASTLFARKGVEGTSMEEIARHAGLTQGAIYSNFRGKADLWEAIAERHSHTVEFEDVFPGERPFREELREAGATLARMLRQSSKTDLLLDQEFYLYLLRHPSAKGKAVRLGREADRDDGPKLEAAAARHGTKLPLDGERMSLLMNVVARGLVHHYRVDPERIDERFCADAFERLAGCADTSPQRRGTAEESSHRQVPGSRRRKSRAPRARG